MEDILVKVALFVLVQALVYLILSNSSDVFSGSKIKKSLSFRPARSVSIHRMLAAISDMPEGGEASPHVEGHLIIANPTNSQDP
ncbi:hypothetical protein RJ639_041254 [Escallonia herrerae]|uniref:Uncharacterized protein n=1 Tax=Escallonia herrerae TaxID=1293975 RepID=A0AA88WHC8_9ASTE|nr:hypothetical protein RJ639_041254 [Escallonia herrerae]